MASNVARHQLRVFQEKAELDGRIAALTAFRQSDNAGNVQTGDWNLLGLQLTAMLEYSRILDRRIAYWGLRQEFETHLSGSHPPDSHPT